MSFVVAARRALAALPSGISSEGAENSASIEELTLHVRLGGKLEIVTLSLRGGHLSCRSSDGLDDGPHVRAALELLVGGGPSPSGAAGGRPRRAGESVSIPSSDEHEQAESLEHLVTTVARIGVDRAAAAPAVRDAIERLLAHAPDDAGLARLLGRLTEALNAKSLSETAWLLEGVSGRASAAARQSGPGLPTDSASPPRRPDEGRSVDLSRKGNAGGGVEDEEKWVGLPGSGTRALGDASVAPREPTALHARRMVEVGREWLAAPTRAAIQRRYLIDLDSGLSYREDRRRDSSASIGPCPRQLEVGMARAVSDALPAALELLQYEVTPRISGDAYRAIEGHAARDFDALAAQYRHNLSAQPGNAEPFALIAPAFVALDVSPSLVDAAERVLPLDSEDRGILAVFAAACEARLPTWVAGRLVAGSGRMRLDPVSLAFGTGDATEHLRLR